MISAVRRAGRVRLATGAVAVVTGLVCGGAALVIGRGGATALDTTDVTAARVPATVAPVRAPDQSTVPPASTSTSTPLSPLHALVGAAGSADPTAVTVDIPPVTVSIEAIGVRDVAVRAVGVLENGELEIPGADEVGWYRLGAAPGQAGSTVLAAHVSWNRRSGPFLRLAELEPGASVTVALADGRTRHYEIVARTQHDKRALPADVWRTSGPETLVLITCGGTFDPERRRYDDNIVVTAVPVG